MSDIPFARLRPMKPPFSSTGIYLLGPVIKKQRRSKFKRWGALFRCFTTRAFHLEVLKGYDTGSLMVSFQRFFNRRGKPREVYTDCGANLKRTTSDSNQRTFT